MSNYELQRLLVTSGLSEKEASVYLTGLELGASLASSIAKRADLNRCTTYTILRHLIRNGLMTQYTKNNTTYYVPEDPSRIIKFLERRKHGIEENLKEFKERIQEFNSIAKQSVYEPKIRLLSGPNGIQCAYESVRSASQASYVIRPLDSSEIIICGEKTILISQKERIGIVIESQEIAKMHKNIFDNLPDRYKYPRHHNSTRQPVRTSQPPRSIRRPAT